MNRAELAAALDQVGVTRGYYIDDTPPVGSPDNALHLRREPDGRWAVGHFERGIFDIFQRFDVEADACEFMFMTLVSGSSWSNRVQLTPQEKVRAEAFRADCVARARAEAAARIARHQAMHTDGDGEPIRWAPSVCDLVLKGWLPGPASARHPAGPKEAGP